jgi:hypothetical protein
MRMTVQMASALPRTATKLVRSSRLVKAVQSVLGGVSDYLIGGRFETALRNQAEI